MPAGKNSYMPHHMPMRGDKEMPVKPGKGESDPPETRMAMPEGSTKESMGMAHHAPTRGDREMRVGSDATVSVQEGASKGGMDKTHKIGTKKAGPA